MQPSHLKRSLVEKLRLKLDHTVVNQDINAFSLEATTRNGRLKVQRKEKGQLILRDDLAGLECVNEDIIVDHLRRHFQNKQIYIYVGEILLAMNPYRELGLFSHRQMFKYIRTPTQ